MSVLKFFKDPANSFLCILIALFFLSPAMESSRFVFISSPLVVSLVAILALRVVSLRARDFWITVLLIAMSFFIDLILTFTTNPELDRMLTVIVHMIRVAIFSFILLSLTKRLILSRIDRSVDSFKIGVCGYLLIGVLWSIIFSLLFYIDRGSLSARESAQLPFFYFSFSILTGLRFSTVFPLNLWSITACFLEAIAGIVFLVAFVARITSSLIKHQIYS